MERLVKLTSKMFPSEPGAGEIGSLELNIWLAQLTGLPLIGLKKESTFLKVLILIFGILITTVLTFIYTGFEVYDLTFCLSDLDALTQNACLTLSHIAGLTKTINIFYHYKVVRNVVEQLKMATKKYIISKNQRMAFLRDELQNKIALSFFATIVGFTVCLCFVMLLKNPQAIAGKRFPYRVILPAWLPYPVQLAYMGLSVLLFALQIVAIDYLNINLLNQIRFQLKVLNITFDELIINSSDKSLRIHKKVSVAGKWVTPQARLHDIIEHHILLMGIRADVENIFNFPILVQFFMCLLILAMSGFQAIVSTSKSNGIAMIYCYSFCISCELFLYCWFGNDVFEQSKTLSTSGYGSTWYQFDQQFKKTLLIFLTNAQRPFLFTAGGFMDLSLQSFTGIMGKSYTFITVLQQFYKR